MERLKIYKKALWSYRKLKFSSILFGDSENLNGLHFYLYLKLPKYVKDDVVLSNTGKKKMEYKWEDLYPELDLDNEDKYKGKEIEILKVAIKNASVLER